ncbi:MAG: endo-1,3-alpha-glucanase family glycosylhydrolase [Anaerolineae bacterium]
MIKNSLTIQKFIGMVVLSLLMVGLWPADSQVAAQGKTGLVLAHYYAWFDPSSFEAGKTPFTNPSPYFSTDAGVMTRHVQQAKGAGIDGFVQSWYGPNPSQQTEPNFAQLLNIASANGFTAAVTFEPVNPFLPDNASRIAALQTLLATHAQHPAYLRVDGRPVIYFWATWALTPADWRSIRDAADPGGSAIWIAEGGNTDYLAVFDGMHMYNVAWSAAPGEVNVGIGGRIRAASATYGGYKYWSAVAMPGFDNSRLGGETTVRGRGDGSFLRNSFNGAVRSNPDIIVITSFNEWPEGSHIEPSTEFGDFYLNLTRELISTYKAGGVPASAGVAAAPTAEPAAASTNGEGEPVATVQAAPVQIAQNLPTPTPRADGLIIHIISAGDTLYGVANRYDLALDELVALNQGTIEATSLLSIGQEVIVGGIAVESPTEVAPVIVESSATEDGATPTSESDSGEALVELPTIEEPAFSLAEYPNTDVRDADGAILYEVQPGNTIIEIALIYGLTLDEIYGLNDLNENSLLAVGQEVVVAYVPTPSPSLIGGSADLPIQPETATPLPTVPTPTVIPTITPPVIPTLAPPTPTPAVISALPTVGATPSTFTTNADDSPALLEVGAQSQEGIDNRFLALFAGSIVILLVTFGLFMVYLGRKVK